MLQAQLCDRPDRAIPDGDDGHGELPARHLNRQYFEQCAMRAEAQHQLVDQCDEASGSEQADTQIQRAAPYGRSRDIDARSPKRLGGGSLSLHFGGREIHGSSISWRSAIFRRPAHLLRRPTATWTRS